MSPISSLRFWFAACLVSLMAGAAEWTTLAEWDFADGTLGGWRPARHLVRAEVRDGVLHGVIEGHDPQLISPPLEIPATPYQEVHIRLRNDRASRGELFYTNTFEGEFQGFRGEWNRGYAYSGDGDWQIIRIRPFWQGLGTIRQIRFDPPGGETCQIDWIRVVSRVAGEPSAATGWEAVDGALPGWTLEENGFLEAPPLAIPLATFPWLHLDIESPGEGHATVVWNTEKGKSGKTEFFLPRYPGRHVTAFDLAASAAEQEKLVNLSIRITCQYEAQAVIRAVRLSDGPPQTPDVCVLYFGQENAVNRVGKPARFLLRLKNLGETPARVRLRQAEAAGADDLRAGIDLEADLPWTGYLTVTPTAAGTLQIPLTLEIDGVLRQLTSEPMVVQAPAPPLPAGEIPPVQPAQTRYRVGTYYYPGFGVPRQWRELERDAPWAKPVLGYYDEGNPECVDWQIKWAVEHGINFFLVDWYWVAGETRHMHYLEALRQARYREHLEWAVMWANHNPPKTHSEEDWRNVVQFWIDNYFKDPQYLRIDGLPAVFMWAPHNIRADLGGSEAAAKLADMAQEMVRAAGLPGMKLVSMRHTANEDLRGEGYSAVTSYHWWSDTRNHTENPRYFPYRLVVERSRPGWDTTEKRLREAGLGFIPVVDTGWDARPRHGVNTLVIYDRSPELFRQSLAEAKEWLDERGQNLLILGPTNEWTEGSYIEPCAEYGFAMYQAVHSVFCDGPAPAIVAPTDVGLGPYDFDLATPGATRTDWTFAEAGDSLGWRAMMGLTKFQVEDGAMTAVSTTHDPAFLSNRLELRTADFAAIEVTMSLDPAPKKDDQIIVFWGTEAATIHSRSHVALNLHQDTAEHTYRLPLAGHRFWRGLLRDLRLDPCKTAGHTVRVSRIRLVPAAE